MKKPVKLGLWLLAFAGLAMLGLWLEHERAKARLAAFKAQLVAKGEKLTFADLAVPPPKPGDNGAPDFFRTAEALPKLPDFEAKIFPPYGMTMVAIGHARVSWRAATLPTQGLKDELIADLWPDFRGYVETQRAGLADLSAALAKPAFHFTNFHKTDLTTIMPVEKGMAFRKAALWLQAGALAALHNGDTNEAHTRLLAAIRMMQAWDQGHLLVTAMIYDGGQRGLFRTTWDALYYPSWTDAQLAEWQKLWQTMPGLAVILRGVEGDRAYSIASFQHLRANPASLDFAGLRINPFVLRGKDWLEPFAEKPWETLQDVARGLVWPMWTSYTDERQTLEQLQLELDGWRICVSNYSFATGAGHRSRASPPGKVTSPWLLLSGVSAPFSSAFHHVRFAWQEVERQMMITAIALHRHRLTHGKFPASLGALVPEFLAEVPHDFMDGLPLRYQLQPDGQFRLWSVGEDFKDDGGDPTPVGALSGNPFDWLKGRDWVWPQAASEAEVAAYHAELAAKRAVTPPKPPP